MTCSVRLYGRKVGLLGSLAPGHLTFRYEQEWLDAAARGNNLSSAHPISMSMLLTGSVYDESSAGPFFDGLLPDAHRIREALGRYLQMDASDRYNMLLALGHECPGAISFAPVDEIVVDDQAVSPDYEIIDDGALAEHIRELPSRPLFVDADGHLRLSLAGVHDKAAVLVVGGQIAIPHGHTPTSHILKVDISGLPDSARVENFCLRLAKEVGLDVAYSTVRTAMDIPYLLVARYDRIIVNGPNGRYLRRLHQEDFCQALGRYPAQKYEQHGGPGWADCFAMMARTSSPAKNRVELLNRAVFQFLSGNPDAHAKNYSLVYRRGALELSKLYDVNNAAAFRKHFKRQTPRLAMSIGGEFDPTALTLDHWMDFAKEVRIASGFVGAAIVNMASQLPVSARKIRAEFSGTPADSELLDLVVSDVSDRCEMVIRKYGLANNGLANARGEQVENASPAVGG